MSEKYDQGQRKREKKTQSLLIMDQSYITNYIYTNIIEHKDKKTMDKWIPSPSWDVCVSLFSNSTFAPDQCYYFRFKIYMSKKRKLPTLKNFKDWLKINLDKNTNK